MQNYYIPHVIEKTPDGGERGYDIYSRLLKDRIVFISGEINAQMSDGVIAQLLFLSNQDPEAPIKIYISSNGGCVSSGLGIISTMDFLPNIMETIILTSAMSMGALIACSGTKGHRKSLCNAAIMLHQPSTGIHHSTAADIDIVSRNIMKMRKTLNEILAKNSGQSLERIEKDCDRDFFLDPQEALAYGLIDEIIVPKQKHG